MLDKNDYESIFYKKTSNDFKKDKIIYSFYLVIAEMNFLAF